MDAELTIDQAREIAGLGQRHPRAELVVHHRPWGVIVEARRGAHAVELESFDYAGGTRPDRPIRATRRGTPRR